MFYFALRDADDILENPHVIGQYMDCKEGLTKLEKKIYKLSHMMSTDMGLVLA